MLELLATYWDGTSAHSLWSTCSQHSSLLWIALLLVNLFLLFCRWTGSGNKQEEPSMREGAGAASSTSSDKQQARTKAPAKNKTPDGSPVRVGLVIAHPDDEVMFFLPAVFRLLQTSHEVHLLSLTNGGYDGLGALREKELRSSCRSLSLASCTVAEFADGSLKDEKKEKLADEIKRFAVTKKLELLLTFDDGGVSGHPDHPRVQYYGFLRTVGLLRKYLGPIEYFLVEKLEKLAHQHGRAPAAASDVAVSGSSRLDRVMNRDEPRASFAKGSSFCKAECITLPAYDEHGNERHAVSFAYRGAVCHHYARLDAPWNSVAYLALHKSQLVWFRYLYCCFSSYFLVNKVTWVDVDSVLVSRSKSKNHEAAAGKSEVVEGAGAAERNAKSSNSSAVMMKRGRSSTDTNSVTTCTSTSSRSLGDAGSARGFSSGARGGKKKNANAAGAGSCMGAGRGSRREVQVEVEEVQTTSTRDTTAAGTGSWLEPHSTTSSSTVAGINSHSQQEQHKKASNVDASAGAANGNADAGASALVVATAAAAEAAHVSCAAGRTGASLEDEKDLGPLDQEEQDPSHLLDYQHLADGSDYLDGSTTENETTDIPETDCSILTATTVTLGGGGGQHQQATPLHKSVIEMITPLHARTLRRTSVRTSTNKAECGGAQGPEAGIMPKMRVENQRENFDGDISTANSNEEEKDGAGGAEQAQAALDAQGHQGVSSNEKGKGAEEGLHDQSSFLKTEVADTSSAGQTAGNGHLPGDDTISVKSSDRSRHCKKNNKVKASSAREGKADVNRSSGSDAIVETASAVGEEQEEISTGELKLVSQEQKRTSPRRECEAFCDVSSIHEGDSLIDLVEHLTEDVSPIKTTEEVVPPAIEKTAEVHGVEVMDGARPSSAVEGETEKAKVEENVVAAPTDESNAATTTSVLGQVGAGGGGKAGKSRRSRAKKSSGEVAAADCKPSPERPAKQLQNDLPSYIYSKTLSVASTTTSTATATSTTAAAMLSGAQTDKQAQVKPVVPDDVKSSEVVMNQKMRSSGQSTAGGSGTTEVEPEDAPASAAAEENKSPCAGTTKGAEEQPQTYEEMKEQPLLDQDRTSLPRTSDAELLQDSAPYKSNEETWEDSARVDSSISRIRRIADRIMDNPSKLKLPIQRRRSASGSLRNNVDSLFQQGSTSTTTLQPTSSWTLQPMGTMLEQQLPSMSMGGDTARLSSSAAQGGAGGFGAAVRDSCGHSGAGVDFDTSSCAGGVGTNKKRAGAGAGGRMGAGLGGSLGFPHLTAKKAVSKDFWAYSGSENTPSSFLSDESLLMLANSPIPTAQETLNFVDRDPVAEKKQDRSSRRRGLLQAVASHQAANSTGEGDPQGLVSGAQLTRGLLELDFHNTLSGLVLPSAQGHQGGGDSDSQHLHAALTSGSGLAGATSAQQFDGVAAAGSAALPANSAAGAASGRGGGAGAAHVLTATQSCTGVTGHPGSTGSAIAPPPPAPRYYNFGAGGNGGSYGSSSRGYHRRSWESSRYGGRGGGERGNKNKFPDQHNHHLQSSHGSGGGGGGGYNNQPHGHGVNLNSNGGVQQQRGGNYATSNNYAGLQQICAASPGPTATGALDLNNMQQNINGLYHTELLAPFGCGGVPQHHQGFNLSASGIGGNDMNGQQEQLVQNLNGGGSMEQALTGNGFCQRTQQGFFSAGASNLVGNNITNSSFQQQQLQQGNQFLQHSNINFGSTSTSGQTLQQQNNQSNVLHHTHSCSGQLQGNSAASSPALPPPPPPLLSLDHSLNVAQSSPHQMFNNSQQQLSFTRNSQIMPSQLPSCAPPTSAGSFQAVPDAQTILGGGPPSPQLDFNNPNVGGAAGSSGPDSSASNLNQLIEQLMQDGHSCNGNLLSGSCVGATNGNGIGNDQQQLDFDLLGGLKLGQGGGAMGQSHQLQESSNANQILGGNGNVGSTTCGEEMNSHDLVRQLISQRQLGGQSQELIPLGGAPSSPPLTSTSAVTTVAGESQSEGNEVNPLNPTNAVVPPLTDDAFKLQPASTANAK